MVKSPLTPPIPGASPQPPHRFLQGAGNGQWSLTTSVSRTRIMSRISRLTHKEQIIGELLKPLIGSMDNKQHLPIGACPKCLQTFEEEKRC